MINKIFLGLFLIISGFLSGCDDKEFKISILSSQIDQVSGGSARVQITVPSFMDENKILVTLNGSDVKPSFVFDSENRAFDGVVTGLDLGKNLLVASHTHDKVGLISQSVTLTNYPLSGPIFSGPQQQPFYCYQDDLTSVGLGEADENCMTPKLVTFNYLTTDGKWIDYTPGMERPEDMATTITNEGKEVDFIIRWERGTINRFIYSIAMLSADSQVVETPDLGSWNKKLLFYFRGGVGVGHKQGEYSDRRARYIEGLKRGYAVAFSTGTATTTHYNLQVSAETAYMLKEQFIKEYAVPEYTVAVGQSGGAVQQYIFAQNYHGILDALVPALSYPDMATQITAAADCSLIERWIDFQIMKDADSKWTDWTKRTLLEGFSASNEVSSELFEYGLTHPHLPNGASECSANWNGLVPLALNPWYGTVDGVTPEDQVNTEWTHFADAINVYGVNEDGYANRTWDNVGVQYGLGALTNGDITPEEFLDLNFNVGTFKQEKDMIQEGCPYLVDQCFSVDPSQPIWPEQVDPWGARNFLLSDGEKPAPRAKADEDAIQNAIEGGLVNYGDIQIPTIDLRVDLERFVNMHNTKQSFSVRQRMLNFDGDASNQLIWFVNLTEEGGYFDPTPHALDVMDEWMQNIKENPELSIVENRPLEARDACWAGDGTLVASGDDVWNGILDKNLEKGACAKEHTIYGNPRMIAGDSIAGDIFKCELQPVQAAIESGLYGDWLPSADQIAQLNAIFPEGVCKF